MFAITIHILYIKGNCTFVFMLGIVRKMAGITEIITISSELRTAQLQCIYISRLNSADSIPSILM